MSKVEEKAMEKYPPHGILIVPARGGGYYADKHLRDGYIEGYNQAEKDLELTWEDIRDICIMWIESKTPFGITGEALSIEVLKRFKERKETKN